MESENNSGNPLKILLIAVGVLLVLSLVNWEWLTNGHLKSFKLWSDLFPSESAALGPGDELIDPELLEAGIVVIDTPEEAVDPTSEEDAAEADAGDTAKVPAYKPVDYNDSVAIPAQPPRVDGQMRIEDYSLDRNGLSRLRRALASSSVRPVRIAICGDSYIEGDIFSQDIRSALQQQYGGRGAGYLAPHSEAPGFRRSVRQTSSGWSYSPIKTASSSRYFTLAGDYYTADSAAVTTFKGAKLPCTEAWNRSMILFVAPYGATFNVTTDEGSETYRFDASPSVQALDIQGETKKFSFNCSRGVVILGVWLTDTSGVTVDCMSVRGDSGVSRSKLPVELASEMREYVDYDLIILEYGINALSSAQSNYSAYSRMLSGMISRVRACYPNADILLLGIGDRGQKINGEVHSIATAQCMVDAQRAAARRSGVLFWDTREAMGGEDAIVDWRKNGYVNADYIHLNHKGGAELAKLFVESLNRSLNE